MAEGFPTSIEHVEHITKNIIKYYQQQESTLPGHASFTHYFLC